MLARSARAPATTRTAEGPSKLRRAVSGSRPCAGARLGGHLASWPPPHSSIPPAVWDGPRCRPQAIVAAGNLSRTGCQSICLPLAAGVLLVSAFAIFHGHAHGAEMPATASGLAYGAGFVAATAALHLCGIAIGLSLKMMDRPRVLRLAGAAVAMCGVALIFAR